MPIKRKCGTDKNFERSFKNMGYKILAQVIEDRMKKIYEKIFVQMVEKSSNK